MLSSNYAHSQYLLTNDHRYNIISRLMLISMIDISVLKRKNTTRYVNSTAYAAICAMPAGRVTYYKIL